MNNAGLGSTRLMLVNFVVVSPKRGSVFLLNIVSPNCFENHVSLVATISRSLPTDPTAQVVVVRVPSAVTPSISCDPNDSELVLGVFTGAPLCVVLTGAVNFPVPATMGPAAGGVEAAVDAGCAIAGRTAGIANFCATLLVELNSYRKP